MMNFWQKWRKSIGVFFVLVLVLLALSPKILTGVGEYLLVEERSPEKIITITPALSEKIASEYHEGKVSTIYVFVGNHSRSWKALRKFDFNHWVMSRAREFKIDEGAIRVIKSNLDMSPDGMKYLGQFLLAENISSAEVFVPYYQTRGFRFFTDRALGAKAGSIYVRPLLDNSSNNFERWWLNTALDNLFLDQYLKIFWYYFNTALGVSVFEGGS